MKRPVFGRPLKKPGIRAQVQPDESIRLGGLRAASGRRRADDRL